MPWTKGPKDTRPNLDRFAPTVNNKRTDATTRRHGLMPKGILGELEDAGFGSGSGGGSSTAVATRIEVSFTGNGPFRVGTDVDGHMPFYRAFTIKGATLHRTTQGSSGTTIVDLNINGVTAFTTQANRPSVAAASGPNAQSSTMFPDVTAILAGQYLSMDIDQAETGSPKHLVLTVELEPA